MNVRFALTLALSQKERGQDFWLPSPQGEGLARASPHFVRREFILAFSNA
ncbi:MAG: hypothetical protein LH660_11385 [Phormidesmis sp. CAN_BIN36]|nr:hypothetical protein [Phormidesmis sp. CAN_BIN36]